MHVRIPSPLRSYTDGHPTCKPTVQPSAMSFPILIGCFPGSASGWSTSRAGCDPHMRVFINDEMVRDLSTVLTPDDEVTLMQALSGG